MDASGELVVCGMEFVERMRPRMVCRWLERCDLVRAGQK